MTSEKTFAQESLNGSSKALRRCVGRTRFPIELTQRRPRRRTLHDMMGRPRHYAPGR